MATSNVHTVNGEILGETVAGLRTSYLTDGYGSVTGTQSSAGAIVNTYRYKPYGSLLAKTGGGSDPSFLWRQARLSHSYYYDRSEVHTQLAWQHNGQVRDSMTFRGGFLGRQYPYCGETGAEWSKYKKPAPVNIHPKDMAGSGVAFYAKPCAVFQFLTELSLPTGTITSGKGAVINHLNAEIYFDGCGVPPCGCPNHIEYIEAWTVTNGKFDVPSGSGSGSSSIQDDKYAWDICYPTCITGSSSWFGSFGYYDGCEIRQSSSGFHYGAPGNFCGEGWGPHLLGSASIPAGFPDGPSKKDLYYSTNCCLERDSFEYLAFWFSPGFSGSKHLSLPGGGFCKPQCCC